MARQDVSLGGVALRMAAAVALVLLTYNPSRRSYYHWALTDFSSFSAIKAFPGAVLLAGWVLYLRTALTALGGIGLFLSSLVFGTLVWLLSEWGVIDASRPGMLSWIALVVFALILGVGLSWSHVRRRITGQVDVDELPG